MRKKDYYSYELKYYPLSLLLFSSRAYDVQKPLS